MSAAKAPSVAERLARTVHAAAREAETDDRVLHAVERILLDSLACAMAAGATAKKIPTLGASARISDPWIRTCGVAALQSPQQPSRHPWSC